MSKLVLKNTLYLGLLQLANYVIPLILLPYVSRSIGLERYGVSEFSLEYGMFFAVMVLFGYDFTMSKKLSQNRNDKAFRDELFWNVFYSRLLILGIITPVFIGFGFTMVDDLFTWEILLFTYLISFSRLFSSWWFFQGMEDLKYVAVANTIIKVSLLVLVIQFVKQPEDYKLLILFTGAVQLLVNFSAWVWVIYKFKVQSVIFNFIKIATLMKDSLFAFVNEFLILSFTTVNVILVKAKLNPTELGLYVATMKVVIIVQNLVIQSVSKALYPSLALSFKKGMDKYFSDFNRALKILLPILFIGGIVIILLREMIVRILFGGEYTAVSELLPLVAFLPLLMGASNLFGWQGLYIFNREFDLTKILIVTGLFSVVSVFLVIDNYGASGVLIVRLLSEALLVLGAFVLFLKKKRAFNG